MKFARCGFNANSIEGISLTSRQKNKAKILEILEKTLRCFNFVQNKCLREESPCSYEDFLKELHEFLLDGNDINMEEGEYEKVASYIPVGRYHGVSSYTSYIKKTT
jgi:hypothetical protein